MHSGCLLTTSRVEYVDTLDGIFHELMSGAATSWEADGYVPRSVWKDLATTGAFCLPTNGMEVWRTSLFLERLGFFGFAGIRSSIGVSAYMAPFYLEKFGSPGLRDRYLPAIRSGECIPALAITERGNGSDLRRIDCVGELDGSELLVVEGTKDFIANGRQADIFIALVKTDRSSSNSDLAASSFVIVDNTNGCVQVLPSPTSGWKSAGVCQVRFNRCYTTTDSIIGHPNMGLLHLLSALDFERLVAGTLALGGAKRAIQELLTTSVTRQTRGKPLGANQVIGHMVADYTAKVRMLEAFCNEVWREQSIDQLDTISATTVKLQATELEMAVAQDLVRLQGAEGLEADSVAARFHRDSVAGTIAAGPSEVLRDSLYKAECERLARISNRKKTAEARNTFALAGE